MNQVSLDTTLASLWNIVMTGYNDMPLTNTLSIWTHQYLIYIQIWIFMNQRVMFQPVYIKQSGFRLTSCVKLYNSYCVWNHIHSEHKNNIFADLWALLHRTRSYVSLHDISMHYWHLWTLCNVFLLFFFSILSMSAAFLNAVSRLFFCSQFWKWVSCLFYTSPLHLAFLNSGMHSVCSLHDFAIGRIADTSVWSPNTCEKW